MKMYEVEALDTYEVNRLQDKELRFTPKEGYKWSVSEDRLKILTGNNPFNLSFVKVIGEVKEETTEDVIPEEPEETIKPLAKTKRTNKKSSKK